MSNGVLMNALSVSNNDDPVDSAVLKTSSQNSTSGKNSYRSTGQRYRM